MNKSKMKNLYPSNKDNDTHWKAISYIAEITGKDKDYVLSIIDSFFGKWGLKYFIERRKQINIRGIGRFYFHGQTINAYKRHKAKVAYRLKLRKRAQAKRRRDRVLSSQTNLKK